jgi:uncharacterized protein (TIGR01777 family)
MKIIIAGGSGLIGRALTESLAADGHRVLILGRNPAKVKNLPTGAKALHWDGRTLGPWAEELESTDAVVNLAGASIMGEGLVPNLWTKSRKNLIVQSRLNAGTALLNALKATTNKPSVLIQSSAIGYYGPRDETKLDEQSKPAKDFLAQTCVAWEASTKEVEQLGMRHVIIRTGLFFSPNGGVFPLLALPFKLFVGNSFGDGRQYYSWIYVVDHIAALRHLLENKLASGPYNLTAPNPVTNKELARTLGKVLRRPSFFVLPAFLMKLILGELSTAILDGQRVIPKRLQTDGFSFAHPTLESALHDLLNN